MADGKVVIPPDSTGKAIDTSELTRSDGTVVERQRIVIGDPTSATGFVGVGPSLTANSLSVTVAPDDPTSTTNVQILMLLNAMLAQLNKIGLQLGAGVTPSPFDYTIQ